jgi:hypothetical protein
VVPQVLVESVRYRSVAPWPISANGTGLSLQRLVATAYGNEPMNWIAAEPTAGLVNAEAPVDADSDGLPDDWEQAHGLSPTSGTGADGPDGDPDADGQSNLREYRSGTHPNDAASVLTLALSRVLGQDLVMQFEAVGGYSYSIESSEALEGRPWTAVVGFSPESVDRLVQWTPPRDLGNHRYFRVVTPAAP